jgi:hypothetical protein
VLVANLAMIRPQNRTCKASIAVLKPIERFERLEQLERATRHISLRNTAICVNVTMAQRVK